MIMRLGLTLCALGSVSILQDPGPSPGAPSDGPDRAVPPTVSIRFEPRPIAIARHDQLPHDIGEAIVTGLAHSPGELPGRVLRATLSDPELCHPIPTTTLETASGETRIPIRVRFRISPERLRRLPVTLSLAVGSADSEEVIVRATFPLSTSIDVDAALESLGHATAPSTSEPLAVLLARVQILVDAGRLVAADRLLEKARPRLPSQGPDVAGAWLLQALVYRGFASRIPDHGARALRLLEDAAAQASGHPDLETRIFVAQAEILLERARRSTSPADRHQNLKEASARGRLVTQRSRNARPPTRALADCLWSEIALERGWETEARNRARSVATHSDPELRWRAETVLGQIRERRHDWPRALSHYWKAVEAVEELRRGGSCPDGDGGLVRERASAYRNAVRAALITGDAPQSLHLAELARARFGTPPPARAAVAALSRHLGPDEAVLVHYPLEHGVAIWQVTSAGIEAHFAPIPRRELVATIEKLRLVRGEAVLASESLYVTLFAPIRNQLTASRVYLAPFGVLRWIPYDALFDGRDFLVEHYALSQLPSGLTVTGDASPATAPGVPPGSLLAFLDPDTDYDRDGESEHPALPHAEDGVVSLARLLPGSRILRGGHATEAALRQDHREPALLHLACHGEYETFLPWESALLLAGGGGEDGRLRARELRDLCLEDIRLVCLSGCETSLAEVRHTDDLAGFPRAVLKGGAQRLLGSLWKVEDARAGSFMTRFYSHLSKGLSAPLALRQTRLDCLASEDDASPSTWAAWMLLENDVRSPSENAAPGGGR